MTDEVKSRLQRVQLPALIVGGVGLVVWVVGTFVMGTTEQFFQSYLFAFLFWLGIPLGSFSLLMLQHTANGHWGIAIRRLLEAAAITIPLMALLFLPIALFAMPTLYEWANPEIVAQDTILQSKEPYLNLPFFYARAGGYFAIWIIAAFLLYKWSGDQDKTGNPAIIRRFRVVSGIGIVIYFLTMTFAAFDWGMSLEPHWFSAMYGVIFIVGQALTTFAFMILIVALVSNTEPMAAILTTKHFHDLGNLLFATTIFWTYVTLGQYIIIWSGNLPEEVPWYIHRNAAGWHAITIAIVLAQFALPFLLLLHRFIKRNISYLWKVALFVFLIRFLEMFWLIEPAFYHSVLSVPWATYAAPVAVGGIWVWVFIEVLKRRPILPVQDPQMQEVSAHV